MLAGFLGGEDPLKKGMVTHSRILACRIPWTEELGRLQSMGQQKNWTCLSTHARRHMSTLYTILTRVSIKSTSPECSA